jgi:hypothetical protein
VQLIVNREDPTSPPKLQRRWSRSLPGAQVRYVDRLTHEAPPNEYSERFVRQLDVRGGV